MKGFTLLELLLSVAIITILGGVAVPLYSIYESKTSVSVLSDAVVDSLRSTALFSVSGKENSQWGVHFDTGEITIFKGNSFSSRDTSYDNIISLQDELVFSGINDIYFTNKGIPDKTGTITIKSGKEEKNITIDSNGIIDY
jgi:prepilin-type N-terminal cleavage/methylation domain-containing protein